MRGQDRRSSVDWQESTIYLGRILIDLLRAAGPPRRRLPHNECHKAGGAGGEKKKPVA